MEKIENIDELKETLFRKGFPKEIADEVAEKALAGAVDITAEYFTEIGGDEMGYRLQFRADQEQSKAYLNAYTAALLDHPDGIREHTFSASSLITGAEAHRMLKYGKKVAVNKDLFNKERQKYNVWLSIDVDGPRDDNGNYPVLSYHENYFKKKPFDIKAAFEAIAVPVQPLQSPFNLDFMERDFKKAHLIEVIITQDKQEQQGFLAVNPGDRRIDVYDKNLNLVQEEGQQQKTGQEQGLKTGPADEKKKSWGHRPQVKTAQGKSQHKGIR